MRRRDGVSGRPVGYAERRMEPIIVRERRDLWLGLGWLAFSLAVIGYCVFVDRTPAPTLWACVFSGIMVAPGLWYAVTGWSTLTADDDGLRLRNFRGAQRVPWDAVRDFYVFEAGLVGDVVELDDRRTLRWRSEHPLAEALRAAVRARATRAPVREWGPPGGRAVEPLPWIFDYPTPRSIRWDVAITLGVTVVVGALLAVEFSRGGAALFHPPYLKATLLKIAVLLACPIGVLLPSMRDVRDLRNRQRQRVTAREEGLRYEDGSRGLAMTWSEITGVVPAGMVGRFVQAVTIESRRGSFEITNGIADYHRLMNLIARRAPQAMDAWHHAESRSEDLLPPTTRPGVKVHHYRTRPERNALWKLGSVFVVFVGIFLYRHRFTDAIVTALVFGTPLALLLARHLTTRVTTDERGITYERFGKTNSLTWSELDRWRPAGADAFAHLRIEGRDQRWRLWGGLSDVMGLIQTLEAHRPTTPGTNP